MFYSQKTETRIRAKKIAGIRLRHRYHVRCVLLHLLSGRGSHTLTQTLTRAVSVGGDGARVFGDVSKDRFQDGQVDGLSALKDMSMTVRKLSGDVEYSRGKWGVGAR